MRKVGRSVGGRHILAVVSDADPPKQYLSPGKDAAVPVKRVSDKAHKRLSLAADAIAATKRAIYFQGNQTDALKETKMNSWYRTKAVRDADCWEMTPEAARLAARHPEASVAAKEDLAHGGNCAEYAWVAFHYLREHGVGETIQRTKKAGLDHLWALIGDVKKEPASDVAVADAWVNQPLACLWEDYFAYTPKHEQLTMTTMVADGQSFKAGIAAGLKLSAKGLKLVEKHRSGLVTAIGANFPIITWDKDRAGEETYEYLRAGESSAQTKPGAEVTGGAVDKKEKALEASFGFSPWSRMAF